MFAALADHVWQSALFCALVEALALLARGNAARLRLDLWRIAAAKFLFPFAILHAAGQWIGFPVPHSADPPPPLLVSWIRECTPLISPVGALKRSGLALALLVTLAAVLAALCVWRISCRLRIERARTHAGGTANHPGFFHAALLTSCAIAVIAAPLIAGAVHDRQRRIEWLIDNSLALRNAQITLAPAAPGMGMRYRVVVDSNGVTIRNANVQELVAIAYGVSHYAVFSNQMNSSDDPESISWIVWPRYDLRANGPVPRPDDFDPYALHQGVTKVLAARFGLQIEFNSVCQPPCGHYNVAMPDSPL